MIITRNGVAVAELVPARKRPFPLGAGRDDARLNTTALASDEWWRPMTNQEVEDFLKGNY